MDPTQEIDIEDLKGFVYDIAVGGTQADGFAKTNEAMGQYVGRVYGQGMKTLVLQQKEAGPTVQEYPESGSEKEKAIWNKKYDLYLKEDAKYKDYKSKVFTLIKSKCTKAMKNRVEAEDGYEKAEEESDVIKLLGMIKKLFFSASDLKYPYMKAAEALKSLVLARQRESPRVV